MSGYEINEKDIATVIRYLHTHHPEDTSREHAIQILELMHNIAKLSTNENAEFAELFLKALQQSNESITKEGGDPT